MMNTSMKAHICAHVYIHMHIHVCVYKYKCCRGIEFATPRCLFGIWVILTRKQSRPQRHRNSFFLPHSSLPKERRHVPGRAYHHAYLLQELGVWTGEEPCNVRLFKLLSVSPCLCLAQRTVVYQTFAFQLHVNCLPPFWGPKALPHRPLLPLAKDGMEGEGFSHAGNLVFLGD